ncbi:hypothetical protein ACTSKR_09625 [Chitinibacteraceae bacterium HSL-7]
MSDTPAKRGRPPRNSFGAMSAAERKRLERERRASRITSDPASWTLQDCLSYMQNTDSPQLAHLAWLRFGQLRGFR